MQVLGWELKRSHVAIKELGQKGPDNCAPYT